MKPRRKPYAVPLLLVTFAHIQPAAANPPTAGPRADSMTAQGLAAASVSATPSEPSGSSTVATPPPTSAEPGSPAPAAPAPASPATETSTPPLAPALNPAPTSAKPQAIAAAPLAHAAASNPARVTVYFRANYPQAKLEGRSVIDFDGWRTLCHEPCAETLDVSGLEVRVVAPGMAPSNAFHLQGGEGKAMFRAAGGSSTLRTLGVALLAAGIPVALTGMGMYGYGEVREKDDLRTVGVATLAIGATATLLSIPLLLLSTTRVYDHKSSRIASSPRLAGISF